MLEFGRATLSADENGDIDMAKKRGRPTNEPLDTKTFSGAFGIRIGPELHEKIARLAEAERRSLNEQVLRLIDEALEARRAAAK